MKVAFITITIIICAGTFTQAQDSEQIRVMPLNDAPVLSLIEQVEKQTSYRFYFDQSWIDTVRVTINEPEVTIHRLLSIALQPTGLKFFIYNHQIILTPGIDLTNDPSMFWDTKTERKKTVMNSPTGLASETKLRAGTGVIEIGQKQKDLKKIFTLSGYVREKETGEPLPGVVVFVKGTKNAVSTNQFGSYTMTLPGGINTVTVELIGMKPIEQKVRLLGDGKLDFAMEESVTQLKEVVVESEHDANIANVQMGVSKIDVRSMKNIPKILGENDLLRVATTLPGVKSVGEGASGLNVRGGHSDQNLVILNEATIYNTSHFLGFFSVFNPDAIRSFELFKSSMPAQYGGRLSSTFELLMRDGNNKKFSGTGGIGPITSQLTLEIPVVANKTSLMVGGRSTYSNWVLRAIPETTLKNTTANFYDFFARLTHSPNDRNSFYFSFYTSRDKFNLSSDTLFSYNNTIGSLQWRHNLKNNIDGILSITRSEYDYTSNYESSALDAFNLGFSIEESNIKYEVNHDVRKHSINYGFQSKYYSMNTGFINKASDSSLVKNRQAGREKALESAVFVGDNFEITPNVSIYYGVRYSIFNVLGPRMIYNYLSGYPRAKNTISDSTVYGDNAVIKTFHGPEWRASVRYRLNKQSALKASYNRTRQYIHMLSNTVSVSPTDTWKLSDPNILPLIGDQVSFGYYRDLKGNVFELSAEIYYKQIKNILDYKTGATLLVNERIDQEVLQGTGKAYGFEFLLRKRSGKVTGWLGYSYSRTLLQLNSPITSERINSGKFFPANYDKPHDVSFISNYKITRRYSLSLNFVYSTGRPITYPISAYRFGNSYRVNYSDRNAYRIPDYIRADIGFNFEGNHKLKKLAHSFWSVSVYNLFGRRNPYSIYFKIEDEKIKAYKLSIFGAPIPTITYHFKF